jgi:hypothetical protein
MERHLRHRGLLKASEELRKLGEGCEGWRKEPTGSPGWIRTSDHSINSRMLYR